MALDVRTITAADFPDWIRAKHAGFLRPVTDEEVADEARGRLAYTDFARTQGAFDGGRCVATYRSFAQELTVVGGGVVRADAVSNVTVLATHRRRGLLHRMMSTDLAQAKERGEAVATLIAAEYPIYGRFGFGPAAWTTEWEIDVLRSGLDPHRPVASGPDGGRIDLIDGAAVRKTGPAIHERLRARQHGMTDRDARWWEVNTGENLVGPHSWKDLFYAVHSDADGEPDGLVAYRTDNRWSDAKQPVNAATVTGLIAATPAVERALWHFVCSIDWITTVRSGYRAPDDLLPLFLPDPRAARVVTQADWLWVRVLDVVRALEARTYAVPGTLVLDVHDDAGLAGGRYRLEASASGAAACAPTTDDADLALDVRELGTLYLGDESPVRLAALGRIEERVPGAVARAEGMFRAARRAWCPDVF
ncbi:GNAT family N-acetyltransferase [Streptomyces sp. NPDC058195]|uniref:GNAT family N-acetyltransferase n=1 Tax=Streptomyces sp. NPDC058195 TaxID=3346375 RepID=UPI0036E929B2